MDEILHTALSYVIRPQLAHDNRATILRNPQTVECFLRKRLTFSFSTRLSCMMLGR